MSCIILFPCYAAGLTVIYLQYYIALYIAAAVELLSVLHFHWPISKIKFLSSLCSAWFLYIFSVSLLLSNRSLRCVLTCSYIFHFAYIIFQKYEKSLLEKYLKYPEIFHWKKWEPWKYMSRSLSKWPKMDFC